MSRQVDVASGGLCERKKFSRRIVPLRSAKRILERAPSNYYRLGYTVLLGIVHRMLAWRPATQALDSTVTFLNTTDCWTRRRARQPRPAQIPTSWTLRWCIARRSVSGPTSQMPTSGQPSADNIRYGVFSRARSGTSDRRRPALRGIGRTYCNFAYSTLACFRTGMSGSASFQSSRNSR